jgi:serine/threonine protein kinase
MVEKCGTGGYIAPEIQAKNTLVGPEIDIWAFGVMLYEMCTAYKPTKLLNYRYGNIQIFSNIYRFWSYSFQR